MTKPKPSKNGTVDLTVTIELNVTVSYYADTDNDRDFYPTDINIEAIDQAGGHAFQNWLALEILEQCESELEEACCDAIQDDVEDKLITRYETARDY